MMNYILIKKIETSIEYINNNNYPDFIFSYGQYYNKTILPFNNKNINYPLPNRIKYIKVYQIAWLLCYYPLVMNYANS